MAANGLVGIVNFLIAVPKIFNRLTFYPDFYVLTDCIIFELLIIIGVLGVTIFN